MRMDWRINECIKVSRGYSRVILHWTLIMMTIILSKCAQSISRRRSPDVLPTLACLTHKRGQQNSQRGLRKVTTAKAQEFPTSWQGITIDNLHVQFLTLVWDSGTGLSRYSGVLHAAVIHKCVSRLLNDSTVWSDSPEKDHALSSSEFSVWRLSLHTERIVQKFVVYVNEENSIFLIIYGMLCCA